MHFTADSKGNTKKNKGEEKSFLKIISSELTLINYALLDKGCNCLPLSSPVKWGSHADVPFVIV